MEKILLWLLGVNEIKEGVAIRIRPVRLFSLVVGLVYLVVIIWSSWYLVGAKEMATIRTLGKHVDTVGPGFHFKLPAPFSVASKSNVTEYHRMEIGFRTESAGPPAKYKIIPEEALMLTGDANIAAVEFVMQYRISDPARWQFGFEKPTVLLNYFGQSAMRLIVGQSNFDAVTTSGRAKIQAEVLKEVRMLCQAVHLGAEVARITIQDALPPGNVGLAFKDVNNAKTDKERLINEGTSHQNDVVPKAQGEASEIINIANGESAKRIKQATGEIDRWLKVWAQYKNNPEVIRTKLSLETVPFVLQGSRVVVDNGNSGILKHLGLDKLSGSLNPNVKSK